MTLDLGPAKGGRRHRLRLALTMAWRDIRQHKGRSGLVIALIALPILAMSLAATMGFSMLATPSETVATELGQTQGRIATMYGQNGKGQQGPRGDLGSQSYEGEPDPNFVAPKLTDVVPAGYMALPWKSFNLTTPVGAADVVVPSVVTDALNPAFKGKYSLLDGRAPTSASEALASPGLLTRFGAKAGDQFTTSAGTFTIVGTVRDSRMDDGVSRIYLKQGQIPAAMAAQPDTESIYLVGEKPLTWADAKAFNARAVVLTSRSLILNPPSLAEMGPRAKDLTAELNLSYLGYLVLSGSLVGVLALLEVGLLAGAAFAVGARKQQRDLALLAASGAESSMIRTTVSASGMWLGLAGGIAGAVLGSIGGVIAVLVLQAQGSPRFPGLHLIWPVTLGLVVVGVASGLLAAMVPARAVAKQATLAALKSGRTADTPSKWMPRIGWGLLILAAAAMVAAVGIGWATSGMANASRWTTLTTILVIGGAVLFVFGLICLTGSIVKVLTRSITWLPIPLRLAARDAARNRGRTVPAVAAVLAAATLSGAVMVTTASFMQQGSDDYSWRYNINQTGIPLEYVNYEGTQATTAGAASGAPATAGQDGSSSGSPSVLRVDPMKLASALKGALGQNVSTQVLRGTPNGSACHSLAQAAGRETPAQPCVAWALQEPSANRCRLTADSKPKDLDDWRCRGSMSSNGYEGNIPSIVVGGAPELTALLGHVPSAAAVQSLHDGGMVITNKIYLNKDATASVITYDPTAPSSYVTYAPGASGKAYLRASFEATRTRNLPAVVDAPDKALDFYGIVSPATADKLGIPVDDRLMLVTVPQKLTQAQTDKLQGTLAAFLGHSYGVRVETGPPTNVATILWLVVSAAALITLSAAGITAGLALADGRNDHATLASIGADSRLRKALASSQTFLTAILGTVLGLLAGTVPIVVLLSLSRGMPIVLPWLQFVVLLVAVPLFGATAAWTFTRGKLPMNRRQTLA